ncbi:hypothetical protein VNI00_008786 [Paramarasmius palmivorus]|uniref:MYND-type domain-containing protein n=1 Tax=Paramarasmius palmivorus TaxID=297713 RepID=A0AAW0CX04_9AGAR
MSTSNSRAVTTASGVARPKFAICGGCDTAKEGLMRCSGCNQRTYCSKECQKIDWPKHKDICKLMRKPNGEAPEKSNPVIAIARRISQQCEDLLVWVDYVLIAALDLVNNPENALKENVSIVCMTTPVSGSTPVKGKQKMTIKVICTQNDPISSAEKNTLSNIDGEREAMRRCGHPVEKYIWVVYMWHPFPLPNVYFHHRVITPEKLEAFKSLKPGIPVPPLPPIANAAQKYVEYLNYHLRLPKYADLTTLNVPVSDHESERERVKEFMRPEDWKGKLRREWGAD